MSKVAAVWLVASVSGLAWGQDTESSREPVRIAVKREVLHTVSPLLFGQFLEDAGHEGGEWGPQAALVEGTDELEPAAMAALRELHAPIVRFPGGYMVERYDAGFDYRAWLPGKIEGLWLEAAKPVAFERRAFGLVEFFDACEAMRAAPLVVVPTKPVYAGEWTVEQAAEFAAGLVSFADGMTPGAVAERYRGWVEARMEAGRVRPGGVDFWQIGNETWVIRKRLLERWQKEAEQRGVAITDVSSLADEGAWYALQLRLVDAMSRAMRAADPRIRLIADGMPGGDFNPRLAALEPGVDFIADHKYMPWSTSDRLYRGSGEGAVKLSYDDVSAGEVFRAVVSVPGFDEGGRSVWHYNRDNDEHDKPMALTEWNWNGWGRAVNGEPLRYGEWAQALGAAGFVHGIVRAGDRAMIACQSMMIGQSWDITSVRVGEGFEPFVKPTGRVTAFYSRHHGTDRLAVEDEDVPRFAQPLRVGTIQPAERVAAIDVVATASLRRVYVHLIHRSYETQREVAIDLGEVVGEGVASAELRLLLGRTDVDLGDPDFAPALVEVVTEVAVEDGVATFELPAQAVGVLIARADESVVGTRLEMEKRLRAMEREAQRAVKDAGGE